MIKSGASQRVTTDGSLKSLCLEGFQAGLSWLTILNKRENFRAAFANFDVERVARFNSRSVEKLLKDAGIVRHRGKIESTINNAKRALELQDAFGSLASFVWQFEPEARLLPKENDTRRTHNAEQDSRINSAQQRPQNGADGASSVPQPCMRSCSRLESSTTHAGLQRSKGVPRREKTLQCPPALNAPTGRYLTTIRNSVPAIRSPQFGPR